MHFSLHISDDGAGFDEGYISVSSPTGKQYRYYWFYGSDRVSGDDKDGVYSFSINFPQYGEPGTWHVDSVELRDRAGNWLWLSETDLHNMGLYDTQIEVTCIEDITAPQLDDFSFTPTAIDTTSGPATVTFTLNLSDDVSGIGQAYWYLQSPSGAQWQYGNVFEPNSRISGNANGGSYRNTVNFSKGRESGTWKVDGINIRDAAGNYKHYDTGDLEDLGFPVELEVTVGSGGAGGGGGGGPTPVPTSTPS